jgi:hypothetical protein
LQYARQQHREGGGHAPRSHIAHKRNNEEGEVTTKGHRKIHIPPPSPNPSHEGAAPSAETAAVLATEPKEHTTRGEHTKAKHAQGDPRGSHCIHPRKTRQIVGDVVTQRAHSRERNRCPHPSPARQMTQVEVASTECGNITLTVSQGWRGGTSSQARKRECGIARSNQDPGQA